MQGYDWQRYFSGQQTQYKLYRAYGTAVQVILHSQEIGEWHKLPVLYEMTEAFERQFKETHK